MSRFLNIAPQPIPALCRMSSLGIAAKARCTAGPSVMSTMITEEPGSFIESASARG